jgi:hypothetical protein
MLKVHSYGTRYVKKSTVWYHVQRMNNCMLGLNARTPPSNEQGGIFKQSMGARNRAGKGLSYRPARLHSLEELVSWNRFVRSLSLKIRAQR